MEMKRSQKEFVGATSSRTGYGVVLLHAVHTEGERERGREVAGKGRKGRKGRQAHFQAPVKCRVEERGGCKKAEAGAMLQG